MIKHVVTNNKRKDPRTKDREIYEFIQVQERHVSFYEIQQGTGMSSGAVQAAISRCLKKNSNYRIYERQQLSDRSTNRIIRVFSDRSELLEKAATFDFLTLFETQEKLIETNEKLLQGKIIPSLDGTAHILPLEIKNKNFYELEYIVNTREELNSIRDLIVKLIGTYMATKLTTGELKAATIYANARIKSEKNRGN